MKKFKFDGFAEMQAEKKLPQSASEFKSWLDTANVGDWLGYDRELKSYLVKCGLLGKNGKPATSYLVLDMPNDTVWEIKTTEG